jgi:hypothetical protein
MTMDMFFLVPRTWTEYGHRIDCAKQGCDPPHPDNGHVYPAFAATGRLWTAARKPPNQPVNGHATTTVKHVITITDWTPA